jgi:hypothetical protein
LVAWWLIYFPKTRLYAPLSADTRLYPPLPALFPSTLNYQPSGGVNHARRNPIQLSKNVLAPGALLDKRCSQPPVALLTACPP